MAEKKRFDYIDAAKGLAVLLVIFGHTFRESMRADLAWCDVSYVVVYRFHVSLLFLLSGLGFGLAAQRYREQPPLEFLRRKARSLLLPWLSYSVLMYIIFALIWALPPLRGMLAGSAYELISPARYLLDMLKNENPYCFHVWSLQTLFLFTLLTYACERYLPPRVSRAVRLALVFIIPLLYDLFCHDWVWAGKAFMQKAMFFLVGTLIPERAIREHARALSVGGIGCGAVMLLLLFPPYGIDLYASRTTAIPAMYLENAAILGLCLGITAVLSPLCGRAERQGAELQNSERQSVAEQHGAVEHGAEQRCSGGQSTERRGASAARVPCVLRLAAFGRQTMPYYLYHQPFCCAFLGLVLYEKLGVPAPAVVAACMAAGLLVPYLILRLLGGTRLGAAVERMGLPTGSARRCKMS